MVIELIEPNFRNQRKDWTIFMYHIAEAIFNADQCNSTLYARLLYVHVLEKSRMSNVHKLTKTVAMNLIFGAVYSKSKDFHFLYLLLDLGVNIEKLVFTMN